MPNTGFLGWAYVTGSTLTTLTGSDQNVLFYSGSTVLTGSDNFLYDYTNSQLTVTGDLDVSGDLTVTSATTFTPSATATLGDDGTIPVTSTVALVDAGGGNRTGIRFNAAGSAGQILIVKNVGGEILQFHDSEGTALLRGADAETSQMLTLGVYMFVSDGQYWNFIGGGNNAGGDGLEDGS
jgi:hypothetical protein